MGQQPNTFIDVDYSGIDLKDHEIILYTTEMYRDSITYDTSQIFPLKNGKGRISFYTDSTTYADLSNRPRGLGLIIGPKTKIKFDGIDSFDKNLSGTGSFAHAKKYFDWHYNVQVPSNLAKRLQNYSTSERMIYFFEDEFQLKIGRNLDLLLKTKKIDSAFHKKFLDIMKFEWAFSMHMYFSLKDNIIPKKEFLIYLTKTYDPFDPKYNDYRGWIKRGYIERKASYIEKGWLPGEKYITGIWNESDNTYYYIPPRLQPMIAVSQLTGMHDDDKFDYEYTREIYDNFKLLYPDHPQMPNLDRIYTQLAQENNVDYVHTFGTFDRESNLVRNQSHKNYNKLENVISENFQGKNVLVALWANWCGICIPQLLQHQNLKAFLEKEGIDLLYVTLDSQVNSGKWLRNIRKRNLNTWHYFPPMEMHQNINQLADFQDQTDLPRYMLFGKNGEILLDKTLLPTEKEKMYQQIKNTIKR
ncbi:MAG: redoxin family protein [Flavobacteriaceae bacterium]|nr:redoxin family protein [Flavobacteriaceae bacterium]